MVRVGRAALVACWLVSSAPGCGTPETVISCQQSTLVGGVSARSEFLAIAESQEAALCQLLLEGEGEGSIGVCSGVLIGRGAVLTAAHCFAPNVTSSVARFVSVSGDEVRVIRGRTFSVHPTLDLALVTLEAPAPVEVDPIPVGVDVDWAGTSSIQIGGFGASVDGRRLFGVTQVEEVLGTRFRVSAQGRVATCVGDSGGPALLRDRDGRVVVAGVLSGGDADCAGTDVYTRIEPAEQWLRDSADLQLAGEPLVDCALVGQRGSCFGTSAVWCEGETPRVERCTAVGACGFSSTFGAFRCVAPEQDSCGGISRFGQCDGSDALRCIDGEPVRQHCGACGATCAISVSNGFAVCNSRE